MGLNQFPGECVVDSSQTGAKATEAFGWARRMTVRAIASKEAATVEGAKPAGSAGVTGPAQHVAVTGARQQQSEEPQHCPSSAQAVLGRRSKSSRLSARILTRTTFPTRFRFPPPFGGIWLERNTKLLVKGRLVRKRRSGSILVVLLVVGMWLAAWGHDLFESAHHDHAPEKPVYSLALRAQVEPPNLVVDPLPQALAPLLACTAHDPQFHRVAPPRDEGPPLHPSLPRGPSRRGPPAA